MTTPNHAAQAAELTREERLALSEDGQIIYALTKQLEALEAGLDTGRQIHNAACDEIVKLKAERDELRRQVEELRRKLATNMTEAA